MRILLASQESYDKYVLLQLKHEQSDSRIQLAATPEQPITESVTLRKLKSRVSKLETHFKLTVEESARYGIDLSGGKSIMIIDIQTKIITAE